MLWNTKRTTWREWRLIGCDAWGLGQPTILEFLLRPGGIVEQPLVHDDGLEKIELDGVAYPSPKRRVQSKRDMKIQMVSLQFSKGWTVLDLA
jgi:hypothetical protein